MASGEPVSAAWLRKECVARFTGVAAKAREPADQNSGDPV
jgi:xanthosine utilization system XapX-like protein